MPTGQHTRTLAFEYGEKKNTYEYYTIIMYHKLHITYELAHYTHRQRFQMIKFTVSFVNFVFFFFFFRTFAIEQYFYSPMLESQRRKYLHALQCRIQSTNKSEEIHCTHANWIERTPTVRRASFQFKSFLLECENYSEEFVRAHTRFDSNFIFLSGYDHEKRNMCNNNKNTNNILGLCGSLRSLASYGNVEKKNADTACVHSSDNDSRHSTLYLINSVASGFNLWSLRHTVALVLILIEDITFHYNVRCREIFLHHAFRISK